MEELFAPDRRSQRSGHHAQARQLPLKPALVAIAHAFLDSLRGQKDLNRIFLSEYPRYPEQVKTMHCAFATISSIPLRRFSGSCKASRVLREVDAVAAAQTFFESLCIFYQPRPARLH